MIFWVGKWILGEGEGKERARIGGV